MVSGTGEAEIVDKLVDASDEGGRTDTLEGFKQTDDFFVGIVVDSVHGRYVHTYIGSPTEEVNEDIYAVRHERQELVEDTSLTTCVVKR